MLRALATALLLLLAACATTSPPPLAAPAVTWPGAPATPRVRLVATLPGPVQTSRWRRALDAIVGRDTRADDETLQRPFAVAIAPDGAVIVADPDAPGVFRFRGGDRGTSIACRGRDWGTPMAVAFAPDGALLVADAGTAEIVKVAPDGGCKAIGTGELERPTGVAADGQRIVVTDPPRHEVVIFSSAGIARVGRRGEGAGEFDFPTAAALAPDGTFIVVDALNFRVVRLSPAGGWVGSFGRPGDEDGAFARPKGVAVGADGRIYVSDAQRDVVLVFRADGSFEYSVGATGSAPGSFNHPAGLAIAAGRLFVADSHNRRIQVFEILGEHS